MSEITLKLPQLEERPYCRREINRLVDLYASGKQEEAINGAVEFANNFLVIEEMLDSDFEDLVYVDGELKLKFKNGIFPCSICADVNYVKWFKKMHYFSAAYIRDLNQYFNEHILNFILSGEKITQDFYCIDDVYSCRDTFFSAQEFMNSLSHENYALSKAYEKIKAQNDSYKVKKFKPKHWVVYRPFIIKDAKYGNLYVKKGMQIFLKEFGLNKKDNPSGAYHVELSTGEDFYIDLITLREKFYRANYDNTELEFLKFICNYVEPKRTTFNTVFSNINVNNDQLKELEEETRGDYGDEFGSW